MIQAVCVADAVLLFHRVEERLQGGLILNPDLRPDILRGQTMGSMFERKKDAIADEPVDIDEQSKGFVLTPHLNMDRGRSFGGDSRVQE